MGIASLSPINKKPPNKRLFLLQPCAMLCYTATMEMKRHNLYIPKDVYDKIRFLSARKKRSINMQCVHMLESFLLMNPKEVDIYEKALEKNKKQDNWIEIPKELKDKIQYLSDRDLRTFNKECIFLLGQMVEHRRDDLLDFQQENKNDGKET